MAQDMVDCSELQHFDEEFTPQAFGGKKVDDLKEGEHEFEIVDAQLAKTKKAGTLILKWQLLNLGDQQIYEKVNFFTSQMNIDILGAELVMLGIDADKWKPNLGRPFSKELPMALPKLKGVRFAAEKKIVHADNDKTYHNLLIKALLPKIATNSPHDNSIPF